MVAFSKRPLCYQVGVLLLLLATLAYSAGVALPWWVQTFSKTGNSISSHTGLWVGCTSDTTGTCSHIEAPVWLKVVQGLQIAGLIGMLIACAYAIFVNCCLDYPRHSRTIEICTGIGGSLGLVSAMMYVGKTVHIVRKSRSISYSWAFSVDIGACVLAVFIAAIFAVTNDKRVDDEMRLVIEDGNRQPEGRSRSFVNDDGNNVVPTPRSPARTRRLDGTSSSFREVISLREERPQPLRQPLNNNVDAGYCDSSMISQCRCICRQGDGLVVDSVLEENKGECPSQESCPEAQRYTPSLEYYSEN